MRWVLYALAVVLALPFLMGLVIGMCVPLAIGPVRRRLMAHVDAIKSVVATEKRAQTVDGIAMVRGAMVPPTQAAAQAALRDAKRRYDFPPDAGGES